MELWKPNFLNTTTGFVVNTNTLTAEYVLRPDVTFQFVSNGFADDNTTVSMVYSFDETMTVSRLALAGLNAREFRIFYNGLTANTFALTSTGATVASSWSANSETAMALKATPVYCTSVTLEMKKTMVPNAEKAIGYFVVSQERISFSRLPAAKGYSPSFNAKEVVHSLSDGRTRIQKIGDYWSAELKMDYVSESFREELRDVYDLNDAHIFVPFGTTTAWDRVIFPCVWQEPFDFFRFSDNAPAAGFEGSIQLLETTP